MGPLDLWTLFWVQIPNTATAATIDQSDRPLPAAVSNSWQGVQLGPREVTGVELYHGARGGGGRGGLHGRTGRAARFGLGGGIHHRSKSGDWICGGSRAGDGKSLPHSSFYSIKS